MKKFKVLFLVLVASFFVLNSLMSKSNEVYPNSDLRTELIELIHQPSVSLYDAPTVANLLFMVNNNNELIVVDCGTSNKRLASYLKRKLNYKKIKSENIDHLNFYSLKVEFRK